MRDLRSVGLWAGLALALAVPVGAAALSPLLQWRDPIYIIAGFAGVIGLALMLVQPLAVTGRLPGMAKGQGRRVHRLVGIAIVVAVVVHVVALWITSPPDVVDVLLLRSPTPFSLWGVAAMWAVFIAAALAVLRRRIGLRVFRLGHSAAVLIIVTCTILHALLIEGAMESVSKWVLCALVGIATVSAIVRLRVWAVIRRK